MRGRDAEFAVYRRKENAMHARGGERRGESFRNAARRPRSVMERASGKGQAARRRRKAPAAPPTQKRNLLARGRFGKRQRARWDRNDVAPRPRPAPPPPPAIVSATRRGHPRGRRKTPPARQPFPPVPPCVTDGFARTHFRREQIPLDFSLPSPRWQKRGPARRTRSLPGGPRAPAPRRGVPWRNPPRAVPRPRSIRAAPAHAAAPRPHAHHSEES